jgi:hypothetical protein
MIGIQTEDDLRHALTDLLGDVEVDAEHSLRVFRAWCIEHQADIEYLALAGDWPDS